MSVRLFIDNSIISHFLANVNKNVQLSDKKNINAAPIDAAFVKYLYSSDSKIEIACLICQSMC